MDKIPSRLGGIRRRGVRSKANKISSLGAAGHSEPGPSLRTLARLRLRRATKVKEQTASKPLRVMVADDDRRVLNKLGTILTDEGWTVCKVDNPYEIITLARTFRPEVLILDEYFVTSGIDFRNIMANVTRRFPGLRVVVTTGGLSSKLPLAGSPGVWGATELDSGGGVPDRRDLVDTVRRAADG